MKKRLTSIICAVFFTFSAFSAAYAEKAEYTQDELKVIWRNMDYRKQISADSDFRIYVKSYPDNWPYYGAKFEPRAGVYIGTPYNRTYPDIQNSIDTEYDWFVPSDEIKNENCERVPLSEKPSDHTKLRGINLNYALKDKVIDIKDYSNYLYNKIDEYCSRGEDILLVFGKEMNINENFPVPQLYIDAFRFLADYVHTKNNIAIVWAPNDLGGLDTNFEDFYPGDEYVDWIGYSLYTMPHFEGKEENAAGGDLLFMMGDYASPSMHAKVMHQFMADHNIKKPVMITEGGVGFETPDGTDYTDWAIPQIRLYYADLCRAYPEIKCIISFNQYVVPGDLYRYDASNNPRLLTLMQEVTQDPVYLKSYPSKAPYTYYELENNMVFTDSIDLSAYAYIRKKQKLVVRYLIDGKWAGEQVSPPYTAHWGISDLTFGEHTITCEIWDGEKITMKKDYKLSFVPSDASYIYDSSVQKRDCPFSDMSDKPQEMQNAAAFLREKGISNGMDEMTFAPDKTISRAELATLLTRLINPDSAANDSFKGFTDMTVDDWYYDAVISAAKSGIITGYPDGSFRGGNPINTNEFASLTAKLIQNRLGIEASDKELSYVNKLDDWVTDYLKILEDKNIMLKRTDGIFYGIQPVTRGDAAIMLMRLYNVIN